MEGGAIEDSRSKYAARRSWEYIQALLNFCNHLASSSHLHTLAVACFLNYLLQPFSSEHSTADNEELRQVVECILSQVPAPKSAVTATQQAYSYVEACRADMLRCCVLACADRTVQSAAVSKAAVHKESIGFKILEAVISLLSDADHNTQFLSFSKRVVARVFMSDVDNGPTMQSTFTNALCVDVAERCRLLFPSV